MTRTILDLAKPKTTVFDLSNVLNPRVNDDLAKISFHIQYDNKPFNMTGYKMYFISADENMGYINVDGMVDKIEIGDNVGNGDVTFKFPPNVFKKAGTFDSAKTMFAIENINSNYIQSTINISLTVLENGVAKFNADVDQIGYDSKLEEIHNKYKDKAQNLIDELINQVQAVDNFSNVKETAEQAKQVANDSIAKANEVNNEVTTARSRFSNLNDRLNNQDIKINSAETVTNANENYFRLNLKDQQQDIAIATKADKDEIDNRLKLYSESLKNTDSVARQAHDVAYNADSRSIANSSRIDNIVTPPKSDSSTEVTDARVGATSLGGFTYPNLGNAIREQINLLSEQLDFSKLTRNVTIVANESGKYISASGNVASTSGFSISKEISLLAGETLYVQASGYLTNVAIVSKKENNSYVPLVKSVDSVNRKYSYQAREDTTIVISYNEQYAHNAFIVSSLIDEIRMKNDKLASNLKVDWMHGNYISGKGNFSASEEFKISKPIELQRGDILNFAAKGYLTNVALIALFNPEENTYTPVLVSEDSNQKQYSFEILQNGLYVLSTDVTTEYSPIFVTKNKEEPLADISMFSSIGVIGDSYASGELVFDGNYVDHYEISWGQILGRKNGIKVTNFSKGGLTTQTWLTNEHGLSLLNSSDICDLYILALGINDYSRGKEAYLGTTSDISAQSDTFYGNYSKIINAIKSKAPGSKIVISTIAYKSDLTDKYNDAIRKLATHFGIPVIDQQSEPFFSSDYYLNHMQGGHPTGPVYSGMAKAIQNLIEQSMSDNLSYFETFKK